MAEVRILSSTRVKSVTPTPTPTPVAETRPRRGGGTKAAGADSQPQQSAAKGKLRIVPPSTEQRTAAARVVKENDRSSTSAVKEQHTNERKRGRGGEQAASGVRPAKAARSGKPNERAAEKEGQAEYSGRCHLAQARFPTAGSKHEHSDERLLHCRLQPEHVWCYDCCWVYLGIDPAAAAAWRHGCPHCTAALSGSGCPCELPPAQVRLLSADDDGHHSGDDAPPVDRIEESPTTLLKNELAVAIQQSRAFFHKGPLAAELRDGDEDTAARYRGAPALHPRCLAHYRHPIESDESWFHELSIVGRHPVVITGVHERLDRDIWSEFHLARRHPGAAVAVRHMVVHPDVDGVFGILGDRWTDFDAYTRMSGVLGGASPLVDARHCDWSMEAAHEHGLRVVLYCKDFFFRELAPDWVADMSKSLPRFITQWDCSELLPEQARPETLMAFIGTHQSRTPMHVDKLGTIAYNLCVNGAGCKEWWFVHHDDTPLLEALIRQRGGNLWRDNFWVDPDDLYNARLRFYYVEQRVGDLVVVPPGVPHQVRNKGSTLAVAANIVHTGTVAISFDILKRYRHEGVASVYRFKAQVYYAVVDLVARGPHLSPKPDALIWYTTLVDVFAHVVDEEQFAADVPERKPRLCPDATPHTRICDRCSTDIFNRYLHCPDCGSSETGLDLCVQCANYLGGRHPGQCSHELEFYYLYSLDQLRQLETSARQILQSLTINQSTIQSNSPSSLSNNQSTNQ